MQELGKVKQIIEEATGLEVSHFYDDLVFVEHSAVLIRFDKTDLKNFFLYFNPDCDKASREKLISSFNKAAENNSMRCTLKGQFKLSEVPGKEEVRVDFLEA